MTREHVFINYHTNKNYKSNNSKIILRVQNSGVRTETQYSGTHTEFDT
jgi:hypothetical protein